MKVTKVILPTLLVVFVAGFVFLFLTKRTNTPSTQTDLVEPPSTSKTSNIRDVCFTNEEYEATADTAPVISLPFDPADYSTKFWGMVPFCAKLRSGSIHSGLDFELNPNSKIFAATDGTVKYTQVGKDEGSGEIITIEGADFTMDYSGLKNLRVKQGDSIKRGDHIADAVLIPHGEHHLHIGISIDSKFQCPIKYMDSEFRAVFETMFGAAHYSSQTNARCACECENLIPKWQQ